MERSPPRPQAQPALRMLVTRVRLVELNLETSRRLPSRIGMRISVQLRAQFLLLRLERRLPAVSSPSPDRHAPRRQRRRLMMMTMLAHHCRQALVRQRQHQHRSRFLRQMLPLRRRRQMMRLQPGQVAMTMLAHHCRQASDENS